MIQSREIKISGQWLADDMDEDLLLFVDYKITDEGFDHSFGYQHKSGVELVKIRDVVGYETGRDYSTELRLSLVLEEHIVDTLYEALEV